MSTFTTFLSLLKTPRRMFWPLAARGLFDWMPDELYIKCLYRCEMGKKLDLNNPKTFNEKIQWLKLHDHNPEYISWVDKITAKERATEAFGKNHVLETLFVWSSADEIEFDKLPSKCVLKCNHDQGSTIIFDKSKNQNTNEIRKFFARRLKKNAYRTTREWPYKSIKPKILCEPFLAENIIDYKFFCCNGKVIFVNIGQKNQCNHVMHVTFLDLNWKELPFQRVDNPPVEKLPEKPQQLKEMVEMAEKLASGKKFVRIDFYLVNDKIYFSEFTLYPTSGFIKFDPEYGDIVLGDRLKV